MAIIVVKEGKSSFEGQCRKCGCQFTYELSDINLSNYILCPQCTYAYYHPSQEDVKTRGLEKADSPDDGFNYYDSVASSETSYTEVSINEF